jgi:hypothetical protein
VTPSSVPTTLHTPTGDFTFAMNVFMVPFYTSHVTTTDSFHYRHQWSFAMAAGFEEWVQ